MYNYPEIMRRTREYVSRIKDNRNQTAKSLEEISKFKGSPYYDERAKAIQQDAEKNRRRIAQSAKDDLTTTFNEVRQNIKGRLAKAPTPEISSTLSILGMLDDLTPGQMQLYADTMSDCPLAMQMLQQIAMKHSMRINFPDPAMMMRAADVLEGNIATMLTGYTGEDRDALRPSVRFIMDYFQPEEAYMDTSVKSADGADRAFWQKVIQIGDPAMFDSPNATGIPATVQHFFASVDGMLAYMDKQTEGMKDKEKTAAINEILSNCPDQYGAAYRCYKATGEKIELNQ